jgi:hypothetical protein
MTLQEQKSRIEERVARLKESASMKYDMDSDDFTRGIAGQDQTLINTFGSPEEAVKRSSQVMESRKSARKVREALYELEQKHSLREASAISTMGSLIRLGVQEIMADAWKLVPVIWDKVVYSGTSDGYYGIIANAFRPSLPREVPARSEFPEATFDPMNKFYVNVKFGQLLSIEKELVDDDQTSQIGRKASQMGEGVAYWHETAFAAYLSDTAVTVADLTITPDTYTDPDATTGIYKTTGNRINKIADVSPTFNNVAAGLTTLKNMKDTGGKPLLIDPDTIVYTPQDEQLVQRTFGAGANSLMITDTSTTKLADALEVSSNNPLRGRFQLMECRFLPAGAWYLGQRKSYSLLWMERDGLQVLQASPDNGDSFKLDVVQWRTRKRGKMTWAPGGARFWYQGHS